MTPFGKISCARWLVYIGALCVARTVWGSSPDLLSGHVQLIGHLLSVSE